MHADDLRDLDHGLTSRYEAGVMLTANIAVRVIVLLNILRVARRRGLIVMPDHSFGEEVAARVSRRMPARALFAPVGTSVEDMEAAMEQTFNSPADDGAAEPVEFGDDQDVAAAAGGQG